MMKRPSCRLVVKYCFVTLLPLALVLIILASVWPQEDAQTKRNLFVGGMVILLLVLTAISAIVIVILCIHMWNVYRGNDATTTTAKQRQDDAEATRGRYAFLMDEPGTG